MNLSLIHIFAHMNQDIGRIDDIVRAMRAGSDILAENIGDTALAVDRKVAGAKPCLLYTSEPQKGP